MQLTRFTDYALRVLMYLGKQETDTLLQVSFLADVLNIPRSHLVKVVHQLGKIGWIKTFRGKGGGLCLGVARENIILGDVIRQFEATLKPINCNEPVCPIAGNCRLYPALWKAQQAFLAECDKVTLAQLIQSPLY